MMTADQVRQHALDIATAAIRDAATLDGEDWPTVGRITEHEEAAIQVELRTVADRLERFLHHFLPAPVQPVWVPVNR